MQLDNYTVIAIAASTSSLFGLGMLMFSSLQHTFRGFRWIGAAYLLIGMGTCLIPMRGHIPDAVSITLSNTLIALALACLHEGLSQFIGSPNRHRRLSAVLVLCTAGVIHYFSAIAPNLQLRIVFLSLIFAALLGLCGTAMLNRIEDRRFVSQFFTAAIAFLAMAVSLMRAALTLVYHPGDDYLITHWVQTAANLAYLIFIVGCAFCLAWMGVQRVEARLSGQGPPAPGDTRKNRNETSNGKTG